ncbi:unnamed protein product, partial [Tenebrio molitor]
KEIKVRIGLLKKSMSAGEAAPLVSNFILVAYNIIVACWPQKDLFLSITKRTSTTTPLT